MNNTMINDQRKQFRLWAKEKYQIIENAPDLESALVTYSSTMSALQLIALIFPDEPLDLIKGNLKVYLEQHFDAYIEKLEKSE